VLIKEQLNSYPFLGMNAAVTVASVFAVNGRYEDADQYLQQAQIQYNELEWNQITGVGGLFTLARIRWLEGQIKEVRQVYEQMHIATKLPTMPATTVLRLLVKGLLALSAQDYEMAERSFQEAVTINAEASLSSIYSCPQLLLAHLYWHRQRSAMAWNTFAPILRRCEVENTPGVILQEGALAVPLLKLANRFETDVDAGAYAEKLLGMMETAVVPPQPLPDLNPLTERERDVLRLLAQGASNKMIAEELVVSVPTVKSHVSHILSKLHASSRGEAVAIAHTRQLI
jgi:ATP/maltotriose-dependent transcriptional regulator MalT